MNIVVRVVLCTLLIVTGTASKSAVFLSFDGSTGVFGNDLVSSPTFSDEINLGPLSAGQYLISATVSSSFQVGAEDDQDINFTSVTLNGNPFVIGDTGQFEFRYISDVAGLETNVFRLSGTSGQNSSYAGTINIAAVPEPSTWGMLVLGFGVLGFAMRRARGSERRLRRQLL